MSLTMLLDTPLKCALIWRGVAIAFPQLWTCIELENYSIEWNMELLHCARPWAVDLKPNESWNQIQESPFFEHLLRLRSFTGCTSSMTLSLPVDCLRQPKGMLEGLDAIPYCPNNPHSKRLQISFNNPIVQQLKYLA